MLEKVFGNCTPMEVRISSVALHTQHTNSAWEHSFIVDVALNPGHQMFNVSWSWHLRGTFVVFGILPEVLESGER